MPRDVHGYPLEEKVPLSIMKHKYDCIVIGTGCGGAAAAALAAHRGYKTLVLEKNKIAGGRCSTHEIRGFLMDHGHMISRGRKGPHGEVLRRVGCTGLIPRFALGTDMPQKIKIADVTWDIPENAYRRVLPVVLMKNLLSLGFSAREWTEFGRLIFAAATMSEEKTRALDGVSVESFVSHYTANAYLHALFGAMAAVSFGSLPHEASAGELIRTWRTSLKQNDGGYPVTGEGASAIPKSFLRAAERFGALVRLNTPVERIVIQDKAVKGVQVQGKLITAGRVISNAGLRETVLWLAGEEHFDKKFVERIKSYKYSCGGISLKYALDSPIIEWKHGFRVPENFARNISDAFEGRVPEQMDMMLVCTSNIDPALAPKGKQAMMAIAPGPVAEPGKIKWKPWVERMKAEVEAFVPGIEKHTLFCIASTPDVIARETNRTFGDAVGIAQNIDQMGASAPRPVLPVRGLYSVGADVGSSGIATEMATQSAMDLFDIMD